VSTRRRDEITIEGERGVFSRWQSITVANDIMGLNECALDLGDDGAEADFMRTIRNGELFVVKINGRPRLSGRSEVVEAPITPEGTRVRWIIRTKFADASWCSADPSVSVEKTTIKQFVIAQYARLGYAESDFVFAPGADADLMTGVAKGAGLQPDFISAKIDAAKPQPTETVRQVVERHLKRFHMAHWEGPDGKIYVGQPNDEADPTFTFTCRRGPESVRNNCTKATSKQDWSNAVSEMWVYGQSTGKDIAGAAIKGVSKDQELLDVYERTKQFYRPVVLQNTEAKDLKEAETMARRERSARSKDKDAFTIQADAWTWWSDAGDQIPYAPNRVAFVDVFNRDPGNYLVTATTSVMSIDQRATTQLTMLAKGIWVV
jgi:prophage tail gpP-like protein